MSAVYESAGILSEYLLFHYGSEEEILPKDVNWPDGMKSALDFAVRTPSHFSEKVVKRGLDLGCAVGRSTFEMARNCEHVTGMDFSHAFINAAKELKNGQACSYTRLDEANLETPLVASPPTGVDTGRVTFFQGDAMDLPAEMSNFDRVHAANLLCRLAEPMRLISRFPDLVASGGELVLATPCTWLEEFTPRDNWPEGSTFDWLKGNLGESFELISETDEPFLIRETARKFQWTRSMLTVWRRR
ncbi:MAG: putative 4-mercaptohistidine N1-methyltransferase [Luteolibacter sp.]